jgi:putative membrane protein
MGANGSPTSGTQSPGVSSGTANDGRGTTGASTQGTTAGSSTSSTPATLTDDQILYVLHSANLGEMDQAKVAQKKAQNARVKRFASMMLKDHGEADSKGGDVAKKARASLSPSDVSNRLESDAKQMTASISAEKAGKDFDRTYIDAQVKEHRAVLDSIDRDLLPSAKSAEVKELLQTVRPKIEGHLREAEDIQKGLGSK